MLALAGAVLWRAPASPDNGGRGVVLAASGLVVVASSAVLAWPDRSGRWSAGAAGERATARALAGAENEGYTILHDLRLPGRPWNLDHLLVGPGGIIVVETKQWARSVRVGRRRRPAALRPYEWQVETVDRAIPGAPAPIHQFLCVHGAPVRRRWWARNAPVGDGTHLRRWIRRLPRLLSPSEVEDLSRVVRITFVSAGSWERHSHARTAGPDRALVERSRKR